MFLLVKEVELGYKDSDTGKKILSHDIAAPGNQTPISCLKGSKPYHWPGAIHTCPPLDYSPVYGE